MLIRVITSIFMHGFQNTYHSYKFETFVQVGFAKCLPVATHQIFK